MAFGLSFGTNKTKTNQLTAVDKTETGTQATNSTQSTQGTTTNTGSQTGSTTQTGTSATTNTGTSTTTGTGTTQQLQSQQLYSQPILSGLESQVAGLFGTVPGTGVDMSSLKFDPAAYVDGTVKQAVASQKMALDDSLNQMFSGVGGNESTNSMAALLANRARGDAAANIGGITAQATAQGQEILRNNLLAQQQGQASQQNFLTQLLAALRGGTTTSSGTQTSATSEAQQQAQTQAGTQSQTGTSQQNTQETQVQNLVQILSQLMNTTQNTTGTEQVTGTQTKSGGGASFSL